MAPTGNVAAAASNSQLPYEVREKQLITSFCADVPESSVDISMTGFMWVSSDRYYYEANDDFSHNETREVLTWSWAPQVEITYYKDLSRVESKSNQTEFTHEQKGVKFKDDITDLHWDRSLFILLRFAGRTIEDIPEVRQKWVQIGERKSDRILGQEYKAQGDPRYPSTFDTSDED